MTTSTLTDAELAAQWTAWLRERQLRQAILSDRRPEATEEVQRVTLRPVTVQRRPVWQLALQLGPQVVHENVDDAQAGSRGLGWLRDQFLDLRVTTADHQYHLRARAGGRWRQSISPLTKPPPPADAHNREKAYLIPEGTPCSFLQEIGVMNARGQVLAPKYHKFRQINRFLELVADILPEWTAARPFRVVDFGAGKSYLTFALHHLLTQIRQMPVDIIGIDRQAGVVQTCQKVARQLDCQGLRFEACEIESVLQQQPVDLVVSLHACDTATDAALIQAVRWHAPRILAVPCCQHEFAHTFDPAAALSPILQHGILRERFAALATDAARALLLERCGYRTQVVEFIDLEHTPKNLLLRAEQQPLSQSRRQALEEQWNNYRQFLGLTETTLTRGLAPFLTHPAADAASEEPSP